MLPDASCEPDSRFITADRQQLRVPAVPVVLLPEVRQQGEKHRHGKQETQDCKQRQYTVNNNKTPGHSVSNQTESTKVFAAPSQILFSLST